MPRFPHAWLFGSALAGVGAALALTAQAQTPLGSAFTYQGRLTDGGGPASGGFDMQFKLFASAAGSDQVGPTVTKSGPDAIQVSGGLFTVNLDFGTTAFGSAKRWLEIGVKPAGSGSGYTVLVPRQELTATPQAQYSLSAGTVAGLTCSDGKVAKWSDGPTGTWTCGDDVDTNSGGTVTSVGTGAGLTGGPIVGAGTISIADGGVTGPKIADGTITAGKIGTGQVVKGLNGLADAVMLSATGAATLGTAGNTITIHVNVEVPSGTIVLGEPGDTTLIGQGYVEIGSGLDMWAPMIAPPPARQSHSAVWTGTQMIVWGGSDGSSFLNTGGRYDPVTDTWTATSTTNAPAVRLSHTAVWTGTRMIVWGGYGGSPLNTGGQYDATADAWTATSTTNTPAGRFGHTAVWTGAQMIVWGGYDVSPLNSGGRYDASTDTWTAMTPFAPAPRFSHTAVWNRDADGRLGRRGWPGLPGHRWTLRPGIGQLEPDHAGERTGRSRIPHGGVDGDAHGRLGRVERWSNGHGSALRPGDGRVDRDGDDERPRRSWISHGGVDGDFDARLGWVGRVSARHGGSVQPRERHLEPGHDDERAGRAPLPHRDLVGVADDRLGWWTSSIHLEHGQPVRSCVEHLDRDDHERSSRALHPQGGVDGNADDRVGWGRRELGLEHGCTVRPDDRQLDSNHDGQRAHRARELLHGLDGDANGRMGRGRACGARHGWTVRPNS